MPVDTRNWGERNVKISHAMWLLLLQGKHLRRFRVVRNGLPDDAQVVRIGYDSFGFLNVIVRSASWPELEEGKPIPELDVRVETVRESEP